jgi:hypothetical protein
MHGTGVLAKAEGGSYTGTFWKGTKHGRGVEVMRWIDVHLWLIPYLLLSLLCADIRQRGRKQVYVSHGSLAQGRRLLPVHGPLLAGVLPRRGWHLHLL